MNRWIPAAWFRSHWPVIFWSLLNGATLAHTQAAESNAGLPLITKARELSDAIKPEQGRVCAFALEGILLAVDNHSGVLFFQDGSGAEIIEADLNGAELHPGQRIQLRGTNYVAGTSRGLSLGTQPVVNADRLHSATERSGTVYLPAGRHPVQVNWFNRSSTEFLRVEYASPRMPRQTIPDGALFHAATPGADPQWLPGLNYRVFEGEWEKLPDFDSLQPTKVGVAANFDLKIESRVENVGLEFKGFLQVTDDGNYTFYLSSDDGGQLFLDAARPEFRVVGTATIPEPEPITGGQLLPNHQLPLWAKAEGMITFLGSRGGMAYFELISGANTLRVEVLNTPAEIPTHLQHSRVRVQGICPDLRNTDGQRCAGSIVVADWQSVQVLAVASESWSKFSDATVGDLKDRTDTAGNRIVRLQGRLFQDAVTRKVRFEDATGSAAIDLLPGASLESGVEIECLARWSRSGTNIFLHEAVLRELSDGRANETPAPPILTTALQVQQLTREQAARSLPVEIQGVVTWVSDDFRSFMIQDSTRAVFVWVGDASSQNQPQVGDYSKIKGLSRPADFSPVVDLREATVLWKGQMPAPIVPTRDQLLSGSLDAQYVEVRGLVAATHDTYITLLTPDGMLDLEITPAPSQSWSNYLNSIIRARGSLFASWNAETHRVTLDKPMRLGAAIVAVEAPPPPYLFQADQVRAKELMQFDVRSDTFRRVKISGQIVHTGQEMNYLMDGADGLRFRLAQPVPLDSGDEVEVVGLVELGGASPVLRQAVARKVGHAPLPEARQLSVNSLGDNGDATLVWVEGTLVDLKSRGAEQVLELQVGVKTFVARLNVSRTPPGDWPLGSRLKLTGVFCALDGDRLAGRDVNSFELLVNSPSDVRLMARPPWWTLQRLFAVVAALVVGLTLAFIWISSLRQQVERRTVQLHREISERERAEKSRAIELERSRIARDLHDDLGSELTEINMMAAATPGLKLGADATLERLCQIVDKSRSMISSLDGVVWVINSRNDKLTSLIEYLASYAEEFLAKAEIACRVELPPAYSERMIEAEVRHDVLLSIRETLNNAVRHGHPSEVLLQFKVSVNTLEILVKDNGRGFAPDQAQGNGLGNLRQRMSKVGGTCEIQSTPGGGTAVVLKLPLPK